MEQYIKKSALVEEIERIKKSIGSDRFLSEFEKGCNQGKEEVCDDLRNFLDTIEVKELNTWHLQEKEDIYDAIKGWGIYTFACLMKDGTIQKFTGHLDEDYEGNINTHIYGVNDDYNDLDDIVKWIEVN